MLPSTYACPSCKCRACYALHRKGFDRVLSLFGLRPARCLTCNRKFFARYKVAVNGKFVEDYAVGSTSEGKAPRKLDRAA
jgi:hypothetical protein